MGSKLASRPMVAVSTVTSAAPLTGEEPHARIDRRRAREPVGRQWLDARARHRARWHGTERGL